MADRRKSTCKEPPLLVMQSLAYRGFQRTGVVPDRNLLIEDGVHAGVWRETAKTQAGEFRKELDLVIMALTARTLLSKLNKLPASALLDDRLLEKLLNAELSSAILNKASQRDLLSQRLIRKIFNLNLIDDQKRHELISRLDVSEVDEAGLAEDGDTDEEADIESEAEAGASTQEMADSLEESAIAADLLALKEIERLPGLNETEREILSKARIGQSAYRRRMLELWNGKCAVTGLDMQSRLIASHAKPWSSSSDRERLDPSNGLPLVAALDDLFNDFLISFHPETGKMHISQELDYERRRLLCLPWMEKGLRKVPNAQQAMFLAAHFEIFSKKQLEAPSIG
jgi:hypothetical protein